MKTVKLIIVAFLVNALMGCFVLGCSSESITTEENVVDMKGLVNKGSDNRTTVEWDVPWFFDYYLEVDCGDYTDLLIGEATAHVITHYKDGEVIGTIYHSTGTAKSENTGEEFTVREVSFDTWAEQVIDFHFNVKGNMGSQYIGRMSWEYESYDDEGFLIIRKFLCPGNKNGN